MMYECILVVFLFQVDDNQRVSLNLSMEPCLIRISPTLVHTVAIATHILLDSCDKDTRECTSSLLFAAHIICNRTNTGLQIGQVGVAIKYGVKYTHAYYTTYRGIW